MHLRDVNPYVDTSFADWSKTHKLSVHAPRGTAPLPASSSSNGGFIPLVGTSSFGMSGVNAHALFEAEVAGVTDSIQLPKVYGKLERQRQWLLPHALFMAGVVAAKARAATMLCTFAVDLHLPALNSLLDHQVGGKAILPAAGMFEACSAAAKVLLSTASIGGSIILDSLAIAEAVPLAPSAGPSTLLLCEIDATAGTVLLVGSNKQRSRHCAGVLLHAPHIGYYNFEQTPAPTLRSVLLSVDRHEVSMEAPCFASVWQQGGATGGFTLPPPVGDSCLHLFGAFSTPTQPAPLQVPVGASGIKMELSHGCHGDWSFPIAGPNSAGSFQIMLGDGFQLRNLQVKEWTQPAEKPVVQPAVQVHDFFYETAWRMAEVGAAKEAALPTAAMVWSAATPASQATTTGLGQLQQALQKSAAPLTVAITQGSSVLPSASGSGPSSRAATTASLAALTKAAAMEFASAGISSIQVPAPCLAASSSTSAGDAFGASCEASGVAKAKLLRGMTLAVPTNSHIMPMPRGSLANMRLVAHEKDAPGSGEVQIAVQAVGLNFRDVLNVLGMYPGDPGPPGGDCAGVVMAVEPRVTSLSPGDAVFGLAPGCIGPSVFAPASLLVRKPEALPFAAAAATPTVYITVLTALGDVSPGSRVLVHAGTGGIGLAAVELAQALGCSVASTAGSPAKRAHLRSIGIQKVADSRSVSFADALATTATVPDVLLNSLTSPGMVAASAALLGHRGRFVEIGKRDIWSHGRVAQERPDASYRIVAIDFLPPKVLGNTLLRLAELLGTGAVNPPQANLFALGDVASAFRKYSHAQHVGKLVLTAPSTSLAARTSKEGLQVITGGLGALGVLTAGWALCRGNSHLLLLGRSGRGDVQHLLSSNACISMAKCDTATAEDARDQLQFSSGMHPQLFGIMNSAGVLEDAMMVSQTAAGVRHVFAPKLDSVVAMAHATAGQPLEQLVLFSSAAALFGAPGQANYAAANAALDGYATASSASGFSTVAIQWGAWSAGMATDPIVVQRAKRTGLGLLPPADGLDGLTAIVRSALRPEGLVPVLSAVPADWSTLLKV